MQEILLVLASNLKETVFLFLGAIVTLLFLYLRDYRLSEYAGRGYFWYLFQADSKKTDDVIIILLGLISAEIITGALTGLEPSQLLMVGAGLGTATKIKAGGK